MADLHVILDDLARLRGRRARSPSEHAGAMMAQLAAHAAPERRGGARVRADEGSALTPSAGATPRSAPGPEPARLIAVLAAGGLAWRRADRPPYGAERH